MSGVPPVPTFTTSEVLTSSDMQEISTALNFTITNRPLCQVHQATAQSIPNATFTAIIFDTTDIDTDGGRTGTGSATDRYVARTQGWYSISGTVSYAANATGARYCVPAINGAYTPAYSNVAIPGSDYAAASVTTLVHLNVGDYLQLFADQNSGGPLSTTGGPSQTSCLSIIFELAG